MDPVLVLGDTPVEVAVVQAGSPEVPRLQVRAQHGRMGTRLKAALSSTLGEMLGCSVDLTEFHRLAASHKRLSALVERFTGLKPPRLPSVFEAMVNGISCQQLSLAVGIHLLNRISRAYGLRVGENFAFPRPEDLIRARMAHLRKLGFSGRKAEYILALSQAIVREELDLESLVKVDDAPAIARLQEIPGVGRWTAEYALLRGWGRLNVFPADDVGSQNKLQRWLHLKNQPDYAGVHRILDRWSPYRGLIYFYLLLDYQTRQGFFAG